MIFQHICILVHAGKFPTDVDMNTNLSHHQMKNENNMLADSEELPPMLAYKQQNLGASMKFTSTLEYEDTAGLLPQPPLPTASINT